MNLFSIEKPRKPIKVAMIGSCVTRDIFHSHFNKNYKEYFTLSVMCYQRTIMSLMSGVITYTEADIEPLTDWDKEMVEAELNNTFFDDLIREQPEILIVDLYTDARFKTIPIEDSYITVNEWKTIKTKLYKDALAKKNVFMPSDFELQENFLQLGKFLKKELPNIKIVLNQARGVKSYTKESGEEGFFNEFFVDKINKQWERVDKLFIEVLKPLKMDVMNPNIKGYINHIWNVEYIHYVPIFYSNSFSMLLTIYFENQKSYLEILLHKLSDATIEKEEKLLLIENIRSLYISLNRVDKKYIDTINDGIYVDFLDKLIGYNKNLNAYKNFVEYVSYRSHNIIDNHHKISKYMLDKVKDKKIFNHENSNYEKALEKEKYKNYSEAIEFYLLATLDNQDNLNSIYYHLGLTFHKQELYQEACEAFLLTDNKYFKIEKSNDADTQKNKIVLQQYLLNKNMLTVDNWLSFAQKAENLKCWSVASYAYKELVLRDEKFHKEHYFSLAWSLMQEQKYKEASYTFFESTIDESSYLKEFSIEEKIIIYESNMEISNKVYEVYKEIGKDAYFDAYRHIWIVKNKEDTPSLNSLNSIVVMHNSDLHKRYLGKAKYIISNHKLIAFFKRRKEQFYIFTEDISIPSSTTHFMDKDTSPFDLIQDVFFGNKSVAYNVKLGDDDLSILYKEAIVEFNNKNWENSYKKFLEIKKQARDVKDVFPTEYYLYESKFQIDIQSKKVEELLIYQQYKLSAKHFTGIDYLLEKASSESLEYSKQWKELRGSFLKILEDIKKNNTTDMRSIKDIDFLNKIVELSKHFTDTLEAKLLPYQVWFLFSHLFIFARLYTKYMLVRTKALESVLNNNDVITPEILRYKINAMSELRDSENYDKLRSSLLDTDSEYIRKKLQFLGVSELYFNRPFSAVEFYTKMYTKEEIEFSEYIKNKTVAIVGPIQSNLDLGEEIDSHDVVLRFNYRGLNESLKESHGEKTNVSFYITEILIKDRINAKEVECMNELDWVVFDTGHTKESLCFTGVKRKMRSRYYVAHSYANSYFKGTANGIQRVLLDLLRFDVAKIKVYNTNLFLENSYEKNYKSRGSLGADHFNFIWHDPLSNFIFLKRIKEYGIIEADEVLAKILSLTATEYIEALEKRYGRENNDTQ